jgi:hypothetical protein
LRAIRGVSEYALAIKIYADGKLIGSSGGGSGDTLTPTVPITTTATLFEPGAPRVRTLTVTASNPCSTAGENYTVDSVKIDAIAAR